MNSIILFENISMLQQRIEKFFDKRRDIAVITYSGKTVKAEKIPVDANQIIIDTDNIYGDLKSLLAEIRQVKSLADTPIILMSSRPNESFVIFAAKYGKIDILAKPFSDVEFLKKILKYRSAPLMDNIVIRENEESHCALKWNDEYKIGVERIDEEHKQIVDHFEQLYIQITSGNGTAFYEEMLKFLEKYVDYHFEHEEEIQRQINYDSIDQHIAEHIHFKLQIEQVIKEHDGKDATNQDLIKMVLFMKEWLIHHLLIEDKKLGEYMKHPNKG